MFKDLQRNALKIAFGFLVVLTTKSVTGQVTISAAFSGTGSPQQDFIRNFTSNGGTITPPPTDLFTTASVAGHDGTAAIGTSFISLTEIPRFYYYVPYKFDNEGRFSLWVYDRISLVHQQILAPFDVNGTGNNNHMTFVRLAMDITGKAWIVSSDAGANKVYLISIQTNDANVLASSSCTVVDDDVTLNGGTVSTFASGDVAITNTGLIYTLANDNLGKTFLYSGTPNGSSTVFAKRFEITDENGRAFDGKATGLAVNEEGALFIAVNNTSGTAATKSGIYYISRSTVDLASGTVKAALRWEGSGINDLASNQFPVVAPLPLTWGTFNVLTQREQVLLEWEVLQEQGVSHYQVERAGADGVFKQVGVVFSGNGPARTIYKFTDALQGAEGAVLLYRIRSVDLDGKTSFSAIRKVNRAVLEKRVIFSVYPNPVVSDVNLQFNQAEGQYVVGLLNSTGVEMQRLVINVKEQQSVSLSLQNYPAGVYYIRLMSTNKNESPVVQKIIKQ